MSISTEDGQSIELSADDIPSPTTDKAVEVMPLLPPVNLPQESLEDSVTEQLSRQTSRRMSYLQELRSKRDRSDTASMLTVDEITQEVESRRASWDGGTRDETADEDIEGDVPIVNETAADSPVPDTPTHDDEEEEYEEDEEVGEPGAEDEVIATEASSGGDASLHSFCIA
jgi:mitogen-activated protein kinase kinase kinase